MPPNPATTVLSNPATPPVISSPHWGTYASPSIFNNPATSQTQTSSNWNQESVLQINLPSSTSTSLNSPTLMPSSPTMSERWSENRSPPSRSTHEIWSVSNAVTMDEDRDTAEVSCRCLLDTHCYGRLDVVNSHCIFFLMG